MHYIHALNRGVDKRRIAMDDRDRVRFVRNLYLLNDTRPAEHTILTPDIAYREDTRERLVTMHAWCLMGNHYHLLLSEYVENGISEYLRKINIGYTKYFNLRHERTGVLFQGRTKRVPIVTDRHYLYILPYIHLNPLDTKAATKSWRSQHITNHTQALAVAQKYRWSSLRNYMGDEEYQPLLAGSELFADRSHHRAQLRQFLRSANGSTQSKLHLE